MDYRISGDRMKGFADQARRLGKVSGELTPVQIEDTLKGVTAGGGSPSAAEVTFGYVKKTETVTEQAPKGKCWYNGVLLPEVPADVLASFPYCWIRLDTGTGYYELLMASGKWYKWVNDSGSVVFGHEDSNAIKWYRIATATAETTEAWTYYQDHTANNYGASSDTRSAIWSNHDIPNGSATATEIYFKGSEPLTELTKTVTKLVPVERESNYSITSANLNDIAKRTQEMAGTRKLMTPEEIIHFLNCVKFIPISTATSEFTLEFEASADSRLPTVTKGTANSELTLTFASSAM